MPGKSNVFAVCILLFMGSWQNLFAVESVAESNDPLKAIIAEADIRLRLKKLEAFYQITRRDEKRFNKDIYIHLVHAAFSLQDYAKVVYYGEKALRVTWNHEVLKLEFHLRLAASYHKLQLNLQKAYDYCEFVRKLADILDADKEYQSYALQKNFVFPALQLQIDILEQETMSEEKTERILEKLEVLFHIEPLPALLDRLFLQGKILAEHYGRYQQVVSLLEKLIGREYRKPHYLNTLALFYAKIDNKAAAIECLKESFAMNAADAKVAYSLGKLLQHRDAEQAILYLAAAFCLNDSQVSPQAEKLLQHLYFNVLYKDINAHEQEAGYQQLLGNTRKKILTEIKEKQG
jgi:tetratricopeptide (TPR) repeat protein